MGTVVLTSVTSGLVLGSVLPPLGAASSARVFTSYRSRSAVVTVHSSFSLSAQVLMVSTTVAAASSVPPRQPSPSVRVKYFSVPLLLVPGDTVSEHLQGSVILFRKQLKATVRLVASRIADLESIRNDLCAASVTVSQRSSTVERHRVEDG